jgi:hypothetical protein
MATGTNKDRRFGELPLPQTTAATAAMRRLTGLLLSMEHAHPTVEAMLAQFADWERELAGAAPPDSTPRIEPGGTDSQRVYLGHAFDIGAYNPCFPEYRFEVLGAEKVAFSPSSSIASPSTRTAPRRCRAGRAQ